MAQVKKFQNPAGPVTTETAASNPAGSPAATKKKYGKWIRNGVEYEMNNDKMKDLEKYIMNLDPSIQPYVAEEFKRLQNGEDVTIDTMMNQRSGVDDYKILNDRQEKRLQNGKEKEGFLNSLFNTKTHRFNKATHELGKWDPSNASNASNTPTSSNSEEVKKTKLSKLNSSFDYELTDENVQRYKDLPNEDEMKYLTSVLNYLAGINRDTIDASGFEEIGDLESWYKAKNINKEWTDRLINDITSGRQISGEYKDFLDTIGLTQNFGINPELQQQEIVSEFEKQKAKDWSNSGYASVWGKDDIDKYFTYNTDGTFTFKGNVPSGLTGSTGYYFNDEFVDENPMYDYLLGKINYDNKWYSEKDLLNPESLLYRTLAAKDYFNMNKRGEYGNANKIMKASWKGQENLIPAWGEETEDYLGDFYGKRFLYENRNWNMPHTKLRVQSGLDENGAPIYIEKDINDDWVIRRGIDLTKTKFLPDGRRPWSWLITDAYGNTINDVDGISIKDRNLNYDNFIGLYDGSTVIDDQRIPEPRRRISGDVNNDYYNRYAEKTPFGTVYKNANTSEGNGVHTTIPAVLGGKEGDVYANMPTSVYEAISNTAFIKEIQKSADINRKFASLVYEGKDKIDFRILAKYLPKVNDKLNVQLAKEIIEYFKHAKKIKSPESFKKGGIIKVQGGAAVKNLEYADNKNTVIENAKTLNELYKNPYAARTVRENGEYVDSNFWNSTAAALSETDRAELWGLGLDAAGFIGGLIPGLGDGFNIATSTIGANIAYGIADTRKAKAGVISKWAPVGNIIKNTALDFASLLPLVGDVANGANWAKRFVQFVKSSKPALEWIKAGIGGIGIYGGSVALDKVIKGEDLTTDDIKALMYGVMAATGLVRQGAHNLNESRLAAKSHPGAEQIPYKTKYKVKGENDVEVEKDLTLDPTDIHEAVRLKNLGDTKSRAELTKIIKNKYPDISDTEINRILGDQKALKELGLVRNTPWYAPNSYSTAKPEKVPGTFGYFFQPGKRQAALIKRTPTQIAEAATSGRGMGKVGAEWIVAKGQGAPEGYTMTENSFWQRGGVDKTNSTQSETQAQPQRQHNAETQQSTSQQSAQNTQAQQNNSTPQPSVTQQNNTPNVLSAPEWNAKFDQYSRMFGAKYSRNSVRAQFDQRIKSLKNDPDFAQFIDTDPKTTKLWIDREVKRAAKEAHIPEKQLREEVKNILGFKQGGRVLKAQKGQWFRDVWGTVKNGVNKLSSPDSLNTIDSISRFLIGDTYNKKSAENQIKTVKDSLNVSKHDTPTEYYTPNYINAGNAERQFAQSQFQYRPSPTSDFTTYEAFKKQGYDQGNLSLANATRQDSEQRSNNLLRNIEERRSYANIRTDATNQWKDKVAAGIQAIAGIEDVKDKARAESLNQFIYERQQQRDVDMAAVNEFAKAKADYDNQMFIQDEFDKAYKKQFTKDNPYDPSNSEHVKWVSDKKSELQRTYQNRQFDILKSGLSNSQKRLYDRMYSAKSGGKLRPVDEQVTINREKAKDQISINKEKMKDQIKANTFKSVNRNWENDQKAARRALDKMSDRVKSLIMKMLS